MISTIVRVQFDGSIDAEKIRSIAHDSRARFEGMPGLKLKAYTLDTERHEATNFYIWESEAAARALFTPETIERIGGLYGGQISVDFVEIAELVENPRP